MHAGGQTHLILAGDPEITGRIRHALPNDLADKLVDVVPASERDQQSDALMCWAASAVRYAIEDCRFRDTLVNLRKVRKTQASHGMQL
jgi:hypothetical protein